MFPSDRLTNERVEDANQIWSWYLYYVSQNLLQNNIYY
jgi:hypothetical protein